MLTSIRGPTRACGALAPSRSHKSTKRPSLGRIESLPRQPPNQSCYFPCCPLFPDSTANDTLSTTGGAYKLGRPLTIFLRPTKATWLAGTVGHQRYQRTQMRRRLRPKALLGLESCALPLVHGGRQLPVNLRLQELARKGKTRPRKGLCLGALQKTARALGRMRSLATLRPRLETNHGRLREPSRNYSRSSRSNGSDLKYFFCASSWSISAWASSCVGRRSNETFASEPSGSG